MIHLPPEKQQRLAERFSLDDLDAVLRMLDLPDDPTMMRNTPPGSPVALVLASHPWLAHAVYHKAPRITGWLLAAGVNPNERLGKNSELARGQETPLHLAAAHARIDLVNLLLEHGADPSIETIQIIRTDGPPLIYAINAWAEGGVQTMAHLIDQRDGHVDVMAVLRRLVPLSPLNRTPIDGPGYLRRTTMGVPIAPNLSFNTLAKTIRQGYAPAVQVLIEHGFEEVCADGRALWHYALEANAGTVLATLTQQGKGPPPDWKDAQGNSALHLAVVGPADEVLFQTRATTLGGLINGQSRLTTNHAGQTALDLLRTLPGDHATALSVLVELERRELKGAIATTTVEPIPGSSVRRARL